MVALQLPHHLVSHSTYKCIDSDCMLTLYCSRGFHDCNTCGSALVDRCQAMRHLRIFNEKVVAS